MTCPKIDYRTKSHKLMQVDWEKTLKYIPNGSQTLSKCPNRYVEGVYPKYIQEAYGCTVVDENGDEYVDYISGLGPILLGYRNQHIDSGVLNAIHRMGTIFSLPHKAETRLAVSMAECLPWAEKFKFFKTGSEVLSAAVKVARAYTGKNKILVCGYHGWHDWYTIVNDKKAGIPPVLSQYVEKFQYNDIESLRRLFTTDDIAAVVMEPVVYDEPRDGFLHKVAQLARDNAALVIFDEVVTGFRFGTSGAAGYFDVKPDLACYSKAMGNGYPIAALAGPSLYMDVFNRDDFFVSGTFGGDLIGIYAAINVIDSIRDPDQAPLRRVWSSGKRLKDDFNHISKMLHLDGVECVGYPCRTMFKFPTVEHKALFWQECVKRGILFGYANFPTSEHKNKAMSHTCSAMENALFEVKQSWDNPAAKITGKIPIEVFRLVR